MQPPCHTPRPLLQAAAEQSRRALRRGYLLRMTFGAAAQPAMDRLYHGVADASGVEDGGATSDRACCPHERVSYVTAAGRDRKASRNAVFLMYCTTCPTQDGPDWREERQPGLQSRSSKTNSFCCCPFGPGGKCVVRMISMADGARGSLIRRNFLVCSPVLQPAPSATSRFGAGGFPVT